MNRIEITIETKDQSGPGFSSFDKRLKAMETSSDSTVNKVKEKFKKGGTDSGEGYSDNVSKGLEKGLAKAEAQLTAAKARMDKAISLGASDKAKASITYDIKIAESSVAKAKDDVERHGREMSKRLGDGVDNKGLGSRITGIFSKLGESAGKTFTNSSGQLISEGFSSSIKSVLTSPAVMGVGAALAAILVPAIGAALSAGVMLGLGGGVLAAGIMAALKAPAVTAALEGFKTRASRVFEDFGKAFQGPVARAMMTFGEMVDRLGPSFNRIGQSAAPLIDKLAPALASMAEKAMPGIEHAVNNMGPVFDALAQVLPGLGDSIGKFFAVISDQGPGTVQFIKDFVRLIGNMVENLGMAIAALTWVYGKIRGADDVSKDAAKSTEKLGSDMGRSADKAKTFAAAVGELTSKMLEAAGNTLSVRQAARQYEAALDTLQAAVKNGARGISDHTAKGRENATMLDAIASAAKGQAEAMRRSGQANERVNAVMQRGASDYFRQALALGLNRKAATDLTASIFGIPATRKTLTELQNAAKSKREAADYAAQLNRIPRNIYTLIQVDRRESVGPDGHRIGGYRSGGIMSTAASGGIRRGMTLVGEDGPELIDAGGMVYNAGRTRQILAADAGGSGGGLTINIGKLELPNATDGPSLVRELQQWARDNGPIPIKGGVRTI